MSDDSALPAVRPTRRGLVVRIVSGVGWTFVTLGVLMLGFVAHQLWVTDFLAGRHQSVLESELADRFEEVEIAAVPFVPGVGPVLDEPATSGGTTVPITAGESSLTYYVEEAPPFGEAFGQLRIPSLDVEWTFVEGVTLKVLKNGAGHMPSTAVPGQIGNAVISGHRTTFGAPFHDFDKLTPGDQIEVETALGVHVYEIRQSLIVKPTALWVTDQPGTPGGEWEDRDGAWLTLTTCHPKFSARERLIVFAELVGGPNAELIESIK